MGNKPTYFSLQAKMKCKWRSKHGGNVYICRWFVGMGCANKESEIQNDTDSREGKLDPGRMSVIAQLTRKQSEVRVSFHPLWRQVGKSLNTFSSTSFCWWDFWVLFAVLCSFPNPYSLPAHWLHINMLLTPSCVSAWSQPLCHWELWIPGAPLETLWWQSSSLQINAQTHNLIHLHLLSSIAESRAVRRRKTIPVSHKAVPH